MCFPNFLLLLAMSARFQYHVGGIELAEVERKFIRIVFIYLQRYRFHPENLAH